MKQTVEKMDIILLLKEKIKETINPDNLKFSDIGFDDPDDEPVDKTVEDLLEEDFDQDYIQQVRLQTLREIIDMVQEIE